LTRQPVAFGFKKSFILVVIVKKIQKGWAQWLIPVISALGGLRQMDPELDICLGYTVRPCLQKKKKKKIKIKVSLFKLIF
jgi:hypothetical protein